MSTESQESWMYSPKSLISLLGAEYHLMRDAGVLRRFYISSLLILFILLLTGISFSYAFDLLFHSITVEIMLAIFFCLLFFCIYIFLLNTFAKENRAQKGLLNLANIIRIGFVAFMGFLIAQPLIILLFSTSLSPHVEVHKRQIINKHNEQINALMTGEIKKLAAKENYYKKQKELFRTSAYDNEINKIDSRIKILENKAIILTRTTQQTIGDNSFFLFRIEKVNRKYPLSWLFSLLIIILFLVPGYLIYTISSQHEYYRLKKSQEKDLIIAAYNVFTERHKNMFDEQLAMFSRYEDPPFNTIRKQLPVAASMDDFLQKYLHNG